jgi:small-conductance mechanosensitive channel
MMEMLQGLLDRINLASIELWSVEVLAAAAAILASFWVSRTLQKLIVRRLGEGDESIHVYRTVVRLLVWTPGVLFAFHFVGLDLSALFATGGLFAVAVAVAMRSVSENLISGLTLKLERSIKPGDVLEVEGMLVRVESMGFRAAIARTRDGKNVLIPNVELVQSRIANYTYRDSVCRIETTVGVDYSSDLHQVQGTLRQVCEELDWRSRHREPVVYVVDFSDSAVNFSVRVWIEDPWQYRRRTSLLNEAVWRGLKEAGIVIAFPQLDVHFDEGAQPLDRAARA